MSDISLNDIENYWKTKTKTSNKLFEEKQFKKALIGYKNALYRSEILNNHPSNCKKLKIPFTQIYLISCNNLVNTYKALGNLLEAENILKRKVIFLLHFKNSKYTDNDILESELRRASIAYFNFVEQLDPSKNKQTQFYKTLRSKIMP
ncbi:tetratricopeptide repeat protein [Winogradskyella sp. F6397]|uniref:Tetratricopeptide repeat protein n=1 Tax=Winogradskyella marina TaxID=2785530 RepID=A0ABS0EEM6_9FLAO|nr:MULTISPECIES: tetratricopeptide repeat protein [Winogradskyella]MBF8148910.1 tetratricopeptide repeat protein [Winogradskyella marina]